MNNTQETIGKLITDDYKRDAIHIAVIPVTAQETVHPGQCVELVEGGNSRVVAFLRGRTDGKPHSAVGVIDPFLRGPVYPDQRCWLFLFPNTVTGMRHEWQHPAFVEFQPSVPGVEASRKWMEEFAANHYYYPNYYQEGEEKRRYTADELIQAGKEYLESDWKHVQKGSESLRDDTNAEEFWKHFQVITGIQVPADTDQPFCCTC